MIIGLHSRSQRYDGRRRGGGAFDDGGSYYAGSRGPVYNDSNFVFVDPHVLGKILVLHGLVFTLFFSVVIQYVHCTMSCSDYLSATFLLLLFFYSTASSPSSSSSSYNSTSFTFSFSAVPFFFSCFLLHIDFTDFLGVKYGNRVCRVTGLSGCKQ